jgi:Domain of unknown function (DUF4062)
MKVFISSVMRGLEAERGAVQRAAQALDHTVIRSEDFGAIASSAQKACRAAVRDADLVILVLGATYGTTDPGTGKSPTHEEFEEAQQAGRDVLVFVQDEVQRDAEQEAFVREVRQWSGGASTGRFREADDLRDAVTKALSRHERSRSAGAVDPSEIGARLEAATAGKRRGGGDGALHVALVGAPRQTVFSAIQMDDASLQRDLERDTVYGDAAVLPRGSATTTRVVGGVIVVTQEDARVTIDSLGTITIVTPAKRRGRRENWMPALIEEDLLEDIAQAIRFALTTLDRVVDPKERLSDVAIAAVLRDVGYAGWHTRAERDRTEMNINAKEVISARLDPLTRKRAAARQQVERMVADLTAMLRRGATE